MSFTTDWFSMNIRSITNTLTQHSVHDHANILEIGSWEGRSTLWFLQNLPNSRITCIDTFEGGEEHKHMPELQFVEQRFLNNTLPYRSRITLAKGKSSEMLFKVGAPGVYDMVYVDGSHASWDALTDIVMSFQLLKVGGIMMIDDYEGGVGHADLFAASPKPAVDAFISIMKPHIQVVHVGYQLHLKRVK